MKSKNKIIKGIETFENKLKRIKILANNEKLLKLISKYSELEVIPMVDSEVCQGDEYSRWYGSFGASYVNEYTLYDLGDGENIVYKEDKNEIIEYLEMCDWEDEAIKKKLKSIKWKKAIFINVNLPE